MIIQNEPIDAYHLHPALSNSKLKILRDRGPLYWRKAFIDRTVFPEMTDALRLGDGFDTLLFEGQKGFDKKFKARPEGYYSDKDKCEKPWHAGATACKQWLAECEAEGKQPISMTELAMFGHMHASMMEHPIAAELLSLCDYQVTIRANMKRYGVELQARPDGLSRAPCDHSRGKRFTIDVKTTESWSDWYDEMDPESPRSGAAIWKYGYHTQGAIDNCLLALEPGYGQTLHFLIVVEKCEPFRTGVVELTDEYLNIGWRTVERDLARLSQCIRTNVWPGSPQQIITKAPPAWLVDRDQYQGRELAAAAGGA